MEMNKQNHIRNHIQHNKSSDTNKKAQLHSAQITSSQCLPWARALGFTPNSHSCIYICISPPPPPQQCHY